MEDFEDKLGTGILSPCIIYRLVRAFLSFLREALSGSSTIYVVFDGVASVYKEQQQVERLSERCLVFDEASRAYLEGNEGSKKLYVTHLFAEDAMAEAAEDEGEESDGRIEVHFAHSEAELFIAKMISQNITKNERNGCVQRRMIVLSSDSDFLVYPSVPSFSPLHTLQYRIDEKEHGIIMGWCYSRSQFLAAYPSLFAQDENESLVVFSTIAALAGCDYTLPPEKNVRIECARRIIVKSAIGGLRQRDKNKPSARGIFQAVLRYISHFRRNKGGCEDWMTLLVNSIIRAEGAKTNYKKSSALESLAESLDLIRSIYCGENIADAQFSNKSAALRRILIHQTLYLKPIMESGECESVEEKEQKDLSKGRNAHGGSIYNKANFVKFRCEIYSLLAYETKHFHPKNQVEIKSTGLYVSEYCKVGRGRSTTYKKFDVEIPEVRRVVIDQKFRSMEILIRMIAKDENQARDIAKCLSQLSEKYYVAFFAMMLLDYERSEAALLLLTTMFTPISDLKISDKQLVNIRRLMDDSKRKEYLQSLEHILSAVYHAKLAMDAVICNSEHSQHPSGKMTFVENFSLPASAVFCDTRMTIIFSVMSQHQESNSNGPIIRDIQERVNSVLNLDTDHWDSQAEMIWNTWTKHQWQEQAKALPYRVK